MPSPPKPWEVNNNNGTAVVTSPAAAVSLTSSAPDLPARTSTLADASSITTPARPASYGSTGYGSTGYGSTGYGSTGYGSTGYGSMGYGSSGYGSSGYGSMGGYGSTGYGGYGSYGRYGSSYGGYGSSYGGGYGGGYGMNRYGGGGGFGRMGGPGGPDEMGLTQRMEMGTRPAFEVVENIVGSFGGFAQMLESTFMATHSSFMAMVGVAEQLGFLRNYLGQVFSLLAIYRFVRRIVDKVTGRTPVGKPMEMNLMEFQNFEGKAASSGPKMSRKPLIIFFLMVVGLPYMMHKLIKLISATQQKQMALQGVPGAPNNAAAAATIDPAKLEFARAMYDFTAESQTELNLKKGDIVAIISKVDPTTNATSQWWRGRLREGTMGMFPANYVEIIQKGGPANNDAIDDATNALKEAAPAAITTSPETQPTKLV
ncbi:Peroxin 13, N-terminal region-domain-containing protein [Parasitella parasitica]|nr:Peroxin 13, N-terminal region-domain-containing protein [Parasitella parasitica]